MEGTTSGLAVMNQNHKCEACGDIFGQLPQIKAHIQRKHGNRTRWFYTDEPANRKPPDWKKRLETREVNKTLIGPFQCNYCNFPPCNSVKGVACHIGHHDDKKGTGPFVEGVDFTALGTGVPPASKPKRKYTKRQSVGSQVKQALTSGKPTITLDIDLWEGVSIRVPLTLGPPVFIERNSDG